nr:hypothetical protein [Rhodococcus sp. ABRD24]
MALGPVVGGLLVGAFDWRAVFWFNLTLGAVLFFAALWFVPESADPQPGRLDLAGFVLDTALLVSAILIGVAAAITGLSASGLPSRRPADTRPSTV